MKQININQNDFGIILKMQLIDNNNQNINLVNTTLNVIIKYPDGTQHTSSNITVIDIANGLVQITLQSIDTAQLGVYSVYVSITSTTVFSISSTNPINYTVVGR